MPAYADLDAGQAVAKANEIPTTDPHGGPASVLLTNIAAILRAVDRRHRGPGLDIMRARQATEAALKLLELA